ncbi:MAG: chromosomal replication initiator protein DnaA [Planctomycetes bacterium]|nr:chromosomal replication initiator protein DnaA [Planctomycetota bacterium]
MDPPTAKPGPISEPSTAGPDLSDLWNGLLRAICERMQPEQFATWFGRASLVGLDDEQLEIAVLNDFTQDWILKYHRQAIESAILAVLGSKRTLVISVNPELSTTWIPNQVLAEPQGQPAAPAPAPQTQAPKPVESAATGGLLWNSDIELHPGYTFDNFVVGPCNRFGHAAAMGAAEQPGRSYNPFFLHGNVGVGKTHLLQGLCHMILERAPQSRILYLSCETFINHFISALQDGDTTRFRNKYRNVDVLVVDDIHLLANKERTQEEFFHTFNTLYNAGKQIVLSSDSPPKDIPTLQERLVSRFKWGMVTEIEPPCFETRMAIVKRKSLKRGNEFPTSVAEYIASNIENNVRELEGAVTRLLAFSSMSNRPIDHAMAHEALSSILKTTRGHPTLGDVVQAVTQHYHLKPSDLQSSKRTRAVAFPRHVAMYLARTVTGSSFEAIGAHFGGRDHSTVVYAVNKVKELTEKHPERCEEVGRLYTELTGRQMGS